MSYNNILPLPKKSDTPSEKVRKISGYLDDTKQAFVTTTDTVTKEEILTWLTKKVNQNKMLWKKPSLLLFKKIDTVNKTDKSQVSNKPVDTP